MDVEDVRLTALGYSINTRLKHPIREQPKPTTAAPWDVTTNNLQRTDTYLPYPRGYLIYNLAVPSLCQPTISVVRDYRETGTVVGVALFGQNVDGPVGD